MKDKKTALVALVFAIAFIALMATSEPSYFECSDSGLDCQHDTD